MHTHLSPAWIIYVDGSRLDTRHEGSLQSIHIEDSLNRVGEAAMVFSLGAEDLRSAGVLALESEVSIHLGYKDDVAEVFSGRINGFTTVLQERGAPALRVKACNALAQLCRGQKLRSFENKKAGEIISGIIGDYGLSAKVDTFGAKAAFIRQAGESDAAFIGTLAARYGKDVYAHGNTIYVSDTITVNSDDVVFEWGKGLIRFEAREDTTDLVSEWALTGLDPLKDGFFGATAAQGDIARKIGGSRCVQAGGVEERLAAAADAADAREIAVAALTRKSFSFCTATGLAGGNQKLLPGMRVTVKAVGSAVEGEYLTEKVAHHLDVSGGYRTGFTLKRNMIP
jgi:phage protein D